LWTYAEFGYNPRFIAQNVALSVQLNDSRADNALTEIFVGRTNDHLLHTVILRRFTGGGGERIIRLIVDHWPRHHSDCFERFLENRELREQLLGHTFAGLVTGIQIIPKRLHNMSVATPM
jgi:hypothetical protein